MKSFVAVLAFSALLAAQAQPGERAFAGDGCIEAIPGPVTDLEAAAASDKAISFSWNAPRNDNKCVDSFSYFVIEKGQPDPRAFPPQAPSYSVTVKDLKPNTDYVVKVAAVNTQKGTGPFSTVNVKTDRRCFGILPPGPVTRVNVNQASNTKAYISWLPPLIGGCTDGYEIFAEDARTGKRLLRSSTTAPETRVVGVPPGTNMIIRITAMNRSLRGPTRRVTFDMKRYGGGGGGIVNQGSVPAGH